MGRLWARLLDRLRGVPVGPSGVRLFSRETLWRLDGQRYDPAARGQFEYLSGGLVWSDELPLSDGSVLREFAFRYLIAYRASVTSGDERAEFRPVWEQVVRHAPRWPGLRPERRGGPAAGRLRAARRVQRGCLDRLDALADECDLSAGLGFSREPPDG